MAQPRQSVEDRLFQEVSRQNALIQGVAASAIAFAIHETADRSASEALIPIGLAVIAWAVSFAAGIICSHGKQAAMRFNIAELRSEQTTEFSAEMKSSFRQHNRKAQVAYQVQIWLLLAGAVLYVIGHVMHILEHV